MEDFNTVIFWAGRILFGGYFIMMGMMHFMKTDMITSMAKNKNVPAAKPTVLLAGFLLIAGGLGILIGQYVGWAVAALVLFLVPAAFKMHNFWALEDQGEKTAQMSNFMRNMALTGAALLMLFVSGLGV